MLRPLPRGRQDGEEPSAAQGTPFLGGTRGSAPGCDPMPKPAPRSAARRQKRLKQAVGIDMIKEIQKWYECNRRKGPPGEKEFTFDGEKLRRYKASTELADEGSGDS